MRLLTFVTCRDKSTRELFELTFTIEAGDGPAAQVAKCWMAQIRSALAAGPDTDQPYEILHSRVAPDRHYVQSSLN